MDKIVTATPIEDYKIEIITSSGVTGIFDVKPYLNGSAFRELNDFDYFCKVKPAHHGIRWPNDQDFSSDTIIFDIQNSNDKTECT